MGGWKLGRPLLLGVGDPGTFADFILSFSRDAGDMYGGSGEFGSAAAATVLAMRPLEEVLSLRWLFMYASKEPGAGGAGCVEVLPPVAKFANELLLFGAGEEGAADACGAPKLLPVVVCGGVEGFPLVAKLEKELLLLPAVGAAGGVCGDDGAPKLFVAGGGVEAFPLVA